MKRSGITWTPQTLDAFVADPQAGGGGQPDALCRNAGRGDRADLVAFLQKTFK